ncbi:MAG: precorrin-3B C(17)-methyltransferase [Bacteroidota bacterium]
MKITVAGIGPGDEQYLLPMVKQAIVEADVIIGYDYYFQFIRPFIPEATETISMHLGKEEQRAEAAISKALEGQHVMVIGSGDASIYSMASIVYEMVAQRNLDEIELQTLPGVSAFLAAGSKLGAPLGHDFCCISLSDLMTPWSVIEKRIKAAAMGDFVTSLYNPRSKKRYWQLGRLKALFLEERTPTTPVAIVRQVTRPEEKIQLTTLGALKPEEVDMFSLVMIGNSQSFTYKNHMVTPRGYLNRKPHTGEEIQKESFNIVANHLQDVPMNPDDKWAAMRIIHTTGIPEDYQCYQATTHAIRKWHEYLKNGGTIVTDVTMVQSGITKRYVKKYGNQVHCFLNDEDVIEQAANENITRSQSGIRKAIRTHPEALYVIGNAPTALIELTDELQRNTSFNPAGIIGVPVGFVNVVESKVQLAQSSADFVIMEGNRGGSNVAAAIVNAAFTLEEADHFFHSKPNLPYENI